MQSQKISACIVRQSSVARCGVFQQPPLSIQAGTTCSRYLMLSEFKREGEWKNYLTISIDNSKHHDVNWVFGLHLYWYISSEQNKPSDPSRKFSYLRKKKIFLVGEDAGVHWKTLKEQSFSRSSWPVIKTDTPMLLATGPIYLLGL